MMISCICPTYKRPDHLANAVACFEAQDYPQRELIICDDVPQFPAQGSHGWNIIPQKERFSTLPDKFNFMIEQARGDIIVPWEDDDVFFEDHLSSIAKAAAHAPDKAIFASENVWSTYGMPHGQMQREVAVGRFHSSWAYTRPLIELLKGYPTTDALIFDQMMYKDCVTAGSLVTYGDPTNPSFCYRWGNGLYHGSQAGDEHFAEFYKSLEDRPAPPQGLLFPAFDDETKKLQNFRRLRLTPGGV